MKCNKCHKEVKEEELIDGVCYNCFYKEQDEGEGYRIKDVMECPCCGKKLSSVAEECPHCGYIFEKKRERDSKMAADIDSIRASAAWLPVVPIFVIIDNIIAFFYILFNLIL